MDDMDTNETTSHDYWSIFYDLHLDAQTFETIRNQARTLANASKDMQSWSSSAYDRVLRIVNTETLSVLNEYWTKYATYDDPNRTHYYRFRGQCKQIYESTPAAFSTQALQTLARSFGPRLWNAMNVTEYYVNYFWKSGSSAKPSHPQERVCNPMAVFSSVGGDRFSIHYRTNPLAGFHLASALTELAPVSQFAPADEKPKQKVLFVARMQFKAWCTAFQNIAKASIEGKSTTGRLRLRFYVGDAVNFCHALNQLRTKHSKEFNLYGRPWSSSPLRLDGPGFSNGFDRAPLSFNVIDCGNLADEVGFLNILIATIPLLEHSAAAVLYTESMKSYPPQGTATNLLSELLCHEDIASMCVLLGVVPAPYITGVSAHSVDEAYIEDTQPVFNRINWKITTSLDPKSNPAEAKVSADPITLAKLLYEVYLEMFAHESERYLQKLKHPFTNPKGRFRFPQPRYSRSSFAAFLAYLKPRISIDWTDLMETLIKLLEKGGTDQRLVGRNNLLELFLQLHLFGAYTKFPFDQRIDPPPDCGGTPISPYRHDRGLLKSPSPAKIGCLILTVPRRKLRVLYKSCVEDGHRMNMLFQLHLHSKIFRETFTSLHPVFGKLTSLGDGRTCEIEPDSSGWFGQSDLHLCVLVPTWLLLARNPKELEVSVWLYHEYSAMLLLRDVLGPDLEIFRARLLSTEYVHLCESLPGLKAPIPTPISPLKTNVAFANDSHEITFPLLTPETQTFTTRVTIEGKAELEHLASGATVNVKLLSPCAVVVNCEKFEYKCNVPFPVASQGLRIRVARKSGWIDVISQFLPAQIVGVGPEDNPLPLVRDKRYGLCTWNIPYLNFSALSKIGAGEWKTMRDSWFRLHLFGMFSDYEAPLIDTTPLPDTDRRGSFLEFKKSLLYVFEFIAKGNSIEPIVFTITPKDNIPTTGGPLLFFTMGLYLDNNSNSVITETYVVPITPSLASDPRFCHVLSRLGPAMSAPVCHDVYMMWKSMLPAMAERCRDWEHTSCCEFADGVPGLNPEKSPLCSCGIGKVGDGLGQSKWKEAACFATRIAISPLYVAGYLESAKGGPLSQNTIKRLPSSRESSTTRESKDKRFTVTEVNCPKAVGGKSYVVTEVMKCHDCGKDGAKKCGACGEVYYCSRACQRRDWKKHKAACQKIQGG